MNTKYMAHQENSVTTIPAKRPLRMTTLKKTTEREVNTEGEKKHLEGTVYRRGDWGKLKPDLFYSPIN